MMDCKGCAEQVSAYVDGELSEDERRQFELHIEACENCAALLAQEEKLRALIKGLEVEAPPQFRAAWRVRLDEEKHARARFRWPKPARWGMAAAAVLLIGAAVSLRVAGGPYGAAAPAMMVQAEAGGAMTGASDGMALDAMEDMADAAAPADAPMAASGGGMDFGTAEAAPAPDGLWQEQVEEEEYIGESDEDAAMSAFSAPLQSMAPTGDTGGILLPSRLDKRVTEGACGPGIRGASECSPEEARAQADEFILQAQEIAKGPHAITVTMISGKPERIVTAIAEACAVSCKIEGDEVTLRLEDVDLMLLAQKLQDIGAEFDVVYEKSDAYELTVKNL